MAVALLSYGVDLIYEHYAGSLFLGLLKQVSNLRRTHADEHFHEFRAGYGEERHVGFAGNSLCEHGLAGARRANKQQALRHGSAHLAVLSGVMQIIHYLGETFLGLVLTRNVAEVYAFRGLDIYLGVALAHSAEHERILAAGLAHKAFIEVLAQGDKEYYRQHTGNKITHQRAHGLFYYPVECRAGFVQPLCKVGILHGAGVVYLALLVHEGYLISIHLHLVHFLVVDHAHEGAVIHLLDRVVHQHRRYERVEQHHAKQHYAIVKQQRLLGRFYFFHGFTPFIKAYDACKNSLIYKSIAP